MIRRLPDLEVLSYRKTHVVAVQGFPSPKRPHHLNKAGRSAGTYVRVASTNRRADDALIAEMQRFAQGEAFDEWYNLYLTRLSIEALLADQTWYRLLIPQRSWRSTRSRRCGSS